MRPCARLGATKTLPIASIALAAFACGSKSGTPAPKQTAADGGGAARGASADGGSAGVDVALGQKLLARLGAAARATLPADAPPPRPQADQPGTEPDLLALGPCKRPTDEQRAAILRQLAAWDRDLETTDSIAFGCVDPAGTILAVAWEHDYLHELL
jgi:hypothetical protein